MIGTVSAARELSGGRGLFAAAASLTGGLCAGSVVTFAALAAFGAAVAPSRGWLLAAGIVCLAMAAADGAGLRVRPQIRAQVPEHWRRAMPLPLATLLYGLLLGTGLSSAVPAFAAWGVMLLGVALGNVSLAVIVGVALALGRALPLLAAIAFEGLEARLTGRSSPLRAIRAMAAVALAVAAAGVVAESASAALFAPRATDPSVAGTDVAWEDPVQGGVLLQGSAQTVLPGHDPAIGGDLVAWHSGATVTVAARATMLEVFHEPIVGVRQLALTDDWLVFRQLGPGARTRIIAQSIADTSVHKVLASADALTSIGRPAISGTTVVFAGADRTSSWITAVDISTGKSRRVREATGSQLIGPSLLGTTLLYDEIGRCAQTLRVGPLDGTTGRGLLVLPALAAADIGHERGHPAQGTMTPCRGRVAASPSMLWTTALTSASAYVTLLRIGPSGPPKPSLIRIRR
jgi:hypothetical protein